MRPTRHGSPNSPIHKPILSTKRKDGRQFLGKRTADRTSRRETTPILRLSKRLLPEWTHPKRPTHWRPSQDLAPFSAQDSESEDSPLPLKIKRPVKEVNWGQSVSPRNPVPMSKEIGGAALCSSGAVEANFDYSLKKALKTLIDLKKVNDLPVTNPLNFRSAPIVSTFVCSAGSRMAISG